MKLERIAMVLALSAAAASTAVAQSSATQTVTFTVNDVSSIAVSGDPGSMAVDAGGANGTATDASTTYDVTTNAPSTAPVKITAQITNGGDMPTGVTLSTTLADPDATGSATSAGAVVLNSTAAQDVVTGISNLQATGNTITYTLTADVTASAISGATRVVTYTIQ